MGISVVYLIAFRVLDGLLKIIPNHPQIKVK